MNNSNRRFCEASYVLASLRPKEREGTLLRSELLVRGFRLPRQHRLQVLPRVAFLGFGYVFGGACGNNSAAAVAAFGAEVDDPVGRLDDFEVVLDDDDGVTRVGQLVQHFQKFRDVVEVEARRRLVEDVQRASCRAAAQFL